MWPFKPRKIELAPLDVTVHLPHQSDAELKARLVQIAASISNLKELIMATSAEHAAELRAVTAQNEKARAEIVAKIKALEDAIAAGGNTTAEVDEALAALKASVQTDDDMHEDPPPAEPV